jgi:septal ring factor EnvC (AmiA/AmiB activator)
MTDLAERLRAAISDYHNPLMREAADEIERLEAENAEMRLALEAPTKHELEQRVELERQDDEIERLHKVMLTGLTIKAEDEIERLTVKAAEDKRGIAIYLAEITQQRDEIKQLKEDNTRLCIDLFELSETFKRFREEKGSGYKY